jgi:membrane-bound lytic murein transglycosylase A
MQIQGSGRVKLNDGSELRLGYANQNGHPYKPIGRWLIEQGQLSAKHKKLASHWWISGRLCAPVPQKAHKRP